MNSKIKILSYLAETKDDAKRNKYSIKKGTKLDHKIVRKAVKSLEQMKWIRGEKAGIAPIGVPIIRYYLTDLGWHGLISAEPNLIPQAKEVLGERYDELKNDGEIIEKWSVETLLQMIRSLLTSGKIPRGKTFNLEVKRNRGNRVICKYGWSEPRLGKLGVEINRQSKSFEKSL